MHTVGVCPLFSSPVIIHRHGGRLWGWRPTVPRGCWGREERHSPWLVTPLHRKDLSGAEGREGCKRNQDPKVAAALVIDASSASSCRSQLGEQKPRCFHAPVAPGPPAMQLRAQSAGRAGVLPVLGLLARRGHGEDCRALCRGLPHIS